MIGTKEDLFFFHTKWKKEVSHLSKCTYCSSKSARSGAHPSTPPSACNASGRATNELAKDRATETAIMRDHRHLHARAAEWNRAGGASRALTAAKLSTNWRASSLHLPPVARATTTKRHLSPRRSSLSTSVPCPPELWCTRLRRPWPPLAVPSRPQQGRSGL